MKRQSGVVSAEAAVLTGSGLALRGRTEETLL
jgi:hypothetical protein